ncbi:uncharacterized protein [Zea mays]|uniref:Uncharacterized protein n=1 Tax=Zea mays TaxID=4577 RepID=A0A1D6QR55_MAIZE|nr:uncharacterized protein LOC100272605 isoform X1 [Zea mays]AQK59985.1 hypothetical protein ZEAMMB73_Zm00001d053634 [Zea mays]|eukprot:XP_008676751.1 uncharacterized protein LOC100272605 isoform X1 [Zea mays]
MANAADDPMADEAGVEDAFTQEINHSYVPRYHVLSWMETVEGMVAGVASLPPVYLILNREIYDTCSCLLMMPVWCQSYLLETGWGWKRLVPYRPGYVELHVFKKYLGDYFDHNREAFLCAEQKPDPFGWIVAEKSALIAAAKSCLKMEKALLRYCASFLTPDDKRLILRIKDQAKQMIQSEGDQSLIVTICLECIAKEAELMYNYLPCDFDTTEEVAVCNKVRRSALNLMLYKGSESAVAAGAMMGITTEAKSIFDLLSRDHDVVMEVFTCESIREHTASVLTQLGKEFACETATVNSSSARPMGVSDVRDLNSEVSGSMEDCTSMDGARF